MAIINKIKRYFPMAFPSLLPCRKEYNAIRKRTYIAHVYDCSNKSRDYWHALKKAGYSPTMITVRMKNSSVHAIIEVNELYVDPTWNRWGYDLSFWGEPILFLKTESEVNFWGAL